MVPVRIMGTYKLGKKDIDKYLNIKNLGALIWMHFSYSTNGAG